MGQNDTYNPEMIELIKGMARVEKSLEDLKGVKETAVEALQSTRSAHKRIDGIEEDRKWARRTSIAAVIAGAISLICNIILIFVKGGVS